MRFIIILFILCRIYRWLKPKYPPPVLNVYFGVPGSGKTTLAAYLAKNAMKESRLITLAQKYANWDPLSSQPALPDPKFTVNLARRFLEFVYRHDLLKKNLHVWSNVPITGSFSLDPKEDIGKYMMVNGKVIIDEAGIEYNNRNFKQFPPEAVYWYKYHRHYQCSVDVFSQSYEDMDITLRRLAQNYFVVKKSLIPYFVVCKRIKRKVGIDDNTHQIIDKYYFGLPIISSKWIFAPPLWKLFNSFSRKELPEKDWPVW